MAHESDAGAQAMLGITVSEDARPHYWAVRKAVTEAAATLGKDVTIGMTMTILLDLYIREGLPVDRGVGAIAGALGAIRAVSDDDLRLIADLALSVRKGTR